MKQMSDPEEETDCIIGTLRGLSSPLSAMGRSWQKVKLHFRVWTDLRELYKISHPKATVHILQSFIRNILYMVSQRKKDFKSFKKSKIISSIFSVHTNMKLDVNTEKFCKIHNYTDVDKMNFWIKVS